MSIILADLGFLTVQCALRNVSWIAIERWNSLSTEEKRKFARGLQAPEFHSGDSPSPIDPDFVIELMSQERSCGGIIAKDA